MFPPCHCCQVEAAVAINMFVSSLYKEGLFIPSDKAERIGQAGLLFLRLYGELARITFNKRSKRFPLVPKLHYLHHQCLSMIFQARHSPWAENLLIYGVQLEEDYIGRPSRLARRVSPRGTALRVIQRTFLAVRSALNDAVE